MRVGGNYAGLEWTCSRLIAKSQVVERGREEIDRLIEVVFKEETLEGRK